MIRTFYYRIQSGWRAVERARRAQPGRSLHIEALEHRALLSVALPWTVKAAGEPLDLKVREPISEFKSAVAIGQVDRPASIARLTPVIVDHSSDSESPDENVATSAGDPLEDEGGFIDLNTGTNRPRGGGNNVGVGRQPPGSEPPVRAGPPAAPSEPSEGGSVSRADNSWESGFAYSLGDTHFVTPIAAGEPAEGGPGEGWTDPQLVLSETVGRKTAGLPDAGHIPPGLIGELHLAATVEIGIDGARGRSRAFELAASGDDVQEYRAVADANTSDGPLAPGSADSHHFRGASGDAERVIALPAAPESGGARLQESARSQSDSAFPVAPRREWATVTVAETPPIPLAAANQAAADGAMYHEALFNALGTIVEDLRTASDEPGRFRPMTAMVVFAAGIAGQYVVDRAWLAEDDRRVCSNPRSG